MSRVGKKPVDIPQGVNVKLAGQMVSIKGPKGELAWEVPGPIGIKEDGGKKQILLERQDDSRQSRALHGLSRSLVANMVAGVSQGYTRVMEITGTGYRAQVQGRKINFSLGYSHPVEYPLPDGINAEVDKKQTTLTLSGIDKQMLGQVAAEIRKLRPPDAYKGKGVRYAGERIKLKAGKTGKK
ncbi:MAG: 50S ribosomal protein L6 [Actinomycetota bacterium]|nr:50S ribosomal protein L6 [Actinomycetota bacterium]